MGASSDREGPRESTTSYGGRDRGPGKKLAPWGSGLGSSFTVGKLSVSRGLLCSPTSDERLPAEVAHLASLVARRRHGTRSRRPGRGAARAFLAPPCRGAAARAPGQEKAQPLQLETRKGCRSRPWRPGRGAARAPGSRGEVQLRACFTPGTTSINSLPKVWPNLGAWQGATHQTLTEGKGVRGVVLKPDKGTFLVAC